jgi:hypothetical protein
MNLEQGNALEAVNATPSAAYSQIEDRILDEVLARLAMTSPWAAYVVLAALEVETAEQQNLLRSLSVEQVQRADVIIDAAVVEVLKSYGWRSRCQA